ncbi:hypothetical protein GCM10020221_08910 [Streptomyces thioluteus]|uniref:Uncharacterized protein n=1 Tax=Streptomyces thioluteus TaxID=66431 RepID=A0ABN3WJ11_STRTU
MLSGPADKASRTNSGGVHIGPVRAAIHRFTAESTAPKRTPEADQSPGVLTVHDDFTHTKHA